MSAESGLSGATAPLAVRMRPQSIDDVIGQQAVFKPGSPLRALADPSKVSAVSVILWGPPGTGKTSIAHAIARTSHRDFVELSAVTAGVKDVRSVMEHAQSQRDLYGMSTILFLDEIHRFTKAQQDALLPGVENGWVTLVAATTENPSFSVVSPLLSRSLLVRLELLGRADLEALLERALTAPFGLDGVFSIEPEAKLGLVDLASGDARRALTSLESAAATAESQGRTTITVEDVETALDRALLRYDRQGDEHYDVISAFIKSIRGSDPDAAIHYLARMIEAGEDPRFIARRLIISAAEDVGLAQPQALSVAMAAADAVAAIGMPEGRIPLAEATIFLALAPKSNAAYNAINAAISDVREGKTGPVPMHLRDGQYPGAKRLGHGNGYIYPHALDAGIAAQQYSPDALFGVDYYQPTARGAEAELSQRLDALRAIIRKLDV